MDFLNMALSLLGPMLIGQATVPLYGGIKKLSAKVKALPGPFHQFGALATASALTWVSGTLNVALPTDLALFDLNSTSALLAGAMAYGMHAGKKAKG